MKKIRKIIALLVVPVMLLTACDNGGEQASDSKVAPSSVTQAILDEIEFVSAVEKTKDDLDDYYGDVNADTVESASFYICGSGAYPDEIAVIRFNSADDAKSAEEALKTRLEKQISLYETYTPDEMYKLDNAKIFSKGKYAVLLACADNDKAKTVVDSLI